ncbi:MAG: YbhN family protein [Acidimicrobiia bacterium]|nr:YbhN family protein [Acidimicrobiia bacterium]
MSDSNQHDHAKNERPSSRPPWLTLAVVIAVFVAYVVALVLAARRWELPAIGWRGAGLLLAALGSELIAKFVFAELFRVGSMRVGHPVSRAGAIKAALTGSAVARLVPAGGTLTPTTMAWAVRSEDDQMAGVALRVTLLTYGGLLTMTGGAVLWGASTGRHPLLFAGELMLGFLLLMVGLGILGGSPWLGQIIDRLPNIIRKHFAATSRGGRLLGSEVVLVVVRISAEAAVLWGSLQALGIHLTPSETMVTYGISAIVGGLPALPGGLVIVEGGLIGVLTAYGFAAGTVVAPVLIYRVLDYWIPAGVGLGTWAAITRGRLSAEP